ncbi:MAG: UvrB/UvrC motif-containing protein [Microgenomates group bacterium]
MENPITKLKKIPKTEKVYKFFPETPGIYIFWQKGAAIYIGKAINLQRRVSSYFDINLEVKTNRMVAEADSLSFIKVTSELEALLLEAKLINVNQPKYNSISKDDKHPLYIRITKEEYPRIVTARKIEQDQDSLAFFGPFPSSKNVFTVLRSLRRNFHYSDHKLGKRACLYSHIGLCDPCPNEINSIKDPKLKSDLKNEYIKSIRTVKSILSGNIEKVKKELYHEMDRYSKEQDFEIAADLRDKIQGLEYITQPKIPTDFFLENPNLTQDLREKELKGLLSSIKEYFPKLKQLERIECFDIAHLAGSSPTASMVTFIDGDAEKSFYRHFKIKVAKGGDDYSSLSEVAKRRKNHLDTWGKPDLIIVDGGKGQVTAFLDVFEERIPIIGLAKRFETLVIPQRKDEKIIFIEKRVGKGEVLNIIQRIRDEAHRFARRYHHKLMSKNIIPN